MFQQTPIASRPHQFHPSADNLNPRNVESYPTQWQEVISNAKCSFRAYIARKCRFPDGGDGVQEAREYLEDAVKIYLEEGGALKQGNSVINLKHHLLTICQHMQSTKT